MIIVSQKVAHMTDVGKKRVLTGLKSPHRQHLFDGLFCCIIYTPSSKKDGNKAAYQKSKTGPPLPAESRISGEEKNHMSEFPSTP